jgi:tripartite ATP-independent transporter DctM subunit
MGVVYALVKTNPRAAPPPESFSWRQALSSLKNAWGIVILAVFVMGGIYSGIFTPTEAAGAGAFAALALALITRRMPKESLAPALLETATTSSMLYLILVGAYIFGYLLTITRLPLELSAFLTGLDVPRYVILIGIVIFYVIIGMFMDMVPAMFITLPLLFPTVMKLGYDPIWFGVLIVQLGEISLLTPPFGLNLFIVKGLMPGVEMGEIIRGVAPFIAGAIVAMVLYMVFPQLALFLPNLMMPS